MTTEERVKKEVEESQMYDSESDDSYDETDDESDFESERVFEVFRSPLAHKVVDAETFEPLWAANNELIDNNNSSSNSNSNPNPFEVRCHFLLLTSSIPTKPNQVFL